MTDPGPLAGGVQREAVLCARCGDAWDERLVADGAAPRAVDALCPACLLAAQHGEPVDPFPEDPLGSAPTQAQDA